MTKPINENVQAKIDHISEAGTEGMEIPETPVYELTSYEPFEVEINVPPITDDMIDSKMEAVCKQFGGSFVPSGRKVVGPKDYIELALVAYDRGVELKGLTTEKRLYQVGSGSMPIDFDRNVVGMKVGEVKDFDFVAPDLNEMDGDNFKERTYQAHLTVLNIMKEVQTELNDEWLAEHMPFYKSMDELREKCVVELKAAFKQELEEQKLMLSVEKLTERFEGVIDDYWYESTLGNLRRNYEQAAQAQGMDMEDWMAQQGIEEQTFNMTLMFQARSLLTQSFCLDSWARHYELEAGEEDIKGIADQMSQGNGEKFLESLAEDEHGMASIREAATRMVANKDLVERCTFKINYQEGQSLD